jgi:hypothetical protein
MRDSITYNLKYFIMKMSGTKPMKNTMRKPSPMKQTTTAMVKSKKTIMPEGKPNAAAIKVTKTTKATKTPMQMKKSGMGKKC